MNAAPRLLLVDELAHTNAPGLRHAKRWQDVQEMLEAGIDVWTTVNVQHLESLNDPVARITGVRVAETIPDTVLDMADEIELIDLPPGGAAHPAEGRPHLPRRMSPAARWSGFFREGNLGALREMALRRVAQRVDKDVTTLYALARHRRPLAGLRARAGADRPGCLGGERGAPRRPPGRCAARPDDRLSCRARR